MRRSLSAILAVLLYACTAPAQSAQNLAARVAAAPDGTIAFSYTARAAVCGDGRYFIMEITGPHQQSIYHAQGGFVNIGENFVSRCVEGPVRIVLNKRDREVTDIYPYVGSTEGARAVRTDLGSVTPQEAADYLLDLARRTPYLANEAFMAASLGEGVRVSMALLQHARDQRLPAEVRESAVKWIGRTTEREGTVDQLLPALRAIASNAQEQLNVRERAVRALGDFPRGASELRSAYAQLDHPDLRERAVRIFAEIGGDTNTTFVRRVALDENEREDVRERAVRVLGEELGRIDIVRELYSQLKPVSLRERALRSISEHLTSESAQWLRTVAENTSEHESIRDRAIRTLAEAGYIAQVRSLYPRLDNSELKDRIIRVAGEHGSQDDLRWIEQIATNEREADDTRQRAVRTLAEADVATSRLIAIYDAAQSYQLRDRLLRLLAERGDEAAITHLIKVARSASEDDLRRRAIRLLSESSDSRAREFLRTTVTK